MEWPFPVCVHLSQKYNGIFLNWRHRRGTIIGFNGVMNGIWSYFVFSAEELESWNKVQLLCYVAFFLQFLPWLMDKNMSCFLWNCVTFILDRRMHFKSYCVCNHIWSCWTLCFYHNLVLTWIDYKKGLIAVVPSVSFGFYPALSRRFALGCLLYFKWKWYHSRSSIRIV